MAFDFLAFSIGTFLGASCPPMANVVVLIAMNGAQHYIQQDPTKAALAKHIKKANKYAFMGMVFGNMIDAQTKFLMVDWHVKFIYKHGSFL